MSYATTADLSDRLGSTLYARLTDRVAGASANATVAQAILDEAHARAESYLARRFATPIDLAAHPELSQLLRGRVLDLAEFLAWSGSPFVTGVPSRVQAVFDEALRWLESVAAGRISLPAAAAPASPTAQDDSPRYASTPRRFTANELDGL